MGVQRSNNPRTREPRHIDGEVNHNPRVRRLQQEQPTAYERKSTRSAHAAQSSSSQFLSSSHTSLAVEAGQHVPCAVCRALGH